MTRFGPAPAGLSDYETRSIVGFRWWSAEELASTAETVFPPLLGRLLAALLRDGSPLEPIDITDRSAP